MAIHWDSRNGRDSYPYPHNDFAGGQECPNCQTVVRVTEISCDYYASVETCSKCGTQVRCPAIIDDGRFAGLENIIRDAEGLWPLIPGEVPVNCSESVRAEFDAIARTGIGAEGQFDDEW